MSEIEMFRVNCGDNVAGKNAVEFYFKAKRKSDDLQICNFCVSEEGVFYYRKRSRILTPKETEGTRSGHGFISMEDLGNIFEMLIKARLHRYEEGKEKKLKVTAKGRKVVIERDDD